MATIDGGVQAPAKPDARGATMRRLAFTVILASAFAASMIYSVVQPVVPMLAAQFGERMAQMAITVPAIGMLLGGLVGGWVMAAVGKRPLILVSIVALGVLGSAGGLLQSPLAFFASRMALGVAAVFFSTACITLLAELYEGDARAKAMGALQGMATFSAIPTMIILGLVAERLGWRAPFVAYAVFAVPVFLLALVSIRPQAAAATEAAAQAKPGAGVARLWPWFLMVFGFSQLTTMGLTQLPFLLQAEGAGGARIQSLIMAGNALSMGVGAVLGGPLQARFGERKLLLAAVVVAGAGNLVAGLAHGVAPVAAGSILSYLGCGVLLTLSFTMVLNRASEAARGVAVGFIQAAMFVGQFANPLMIAPVRAGVGLHGVYVVVGLLAIAGPVIALGVLALRGRPPATADA
jgi:MFS family permease